MKEITLSNGVKIPSIGFGTWRANQNECYQATKWAIEAGYRLIDTAQAYDNEEEVGQAIKDSNIDRSKLFITSKLANSFRGYDLTIQEFNNSLKRLGLDYLDLFLIHWPNPLKYRDNYEKMNLETWKAFEDLYYQGKIKAIGVSNFMPKHLQQILSICRVKPIVDQILRFPGLLHEETVDFCRKNNIVVEAYSPLGRPSLLSDERIVNLANKKGITPAQLMLTYQIQRGIIPLVKSIHQERIISNLDATNIHLDEHDLEYLDTFPLENIPQTVESIDKINF